MTKKYDLFWSNYENNNLSKEFKDLINHLICFNPNERFTIEDILKHPWIKNNVNYKDNLNEFFIDEDVVKELKKRKEMMENKRTN